MNKPSNKRDRLVVLMFAFLLVGCLTGLVYSAVPQSTVQTTLGGITSYVGHYGNFTEGIYQGTTERLNAAGEATLTSVDADSFFRVQFGQ